MVKDPIFELIMFYWLSGSFIMFGMMIAFMLFSVAAYILSLPVKVYQKIKSIYDERKVQP